MTFKERLWQIGAIIMGTGVMISLLLLKWSLLKSFLIPGIITTIILFSIWGIRNLLDALVDRFHPGPLH